LEHGIIYYKAPTILVQKGLLSVAKQLIVQIIEETAWDYIRNNSPSYSFITIIPSLMIGPLLTRDHMTASHFLFRDILTDKFKSGAPNVGSGFVDVRDVAKAHLTAALNNNITGGRFICNNHSLTLQEICIAIEPQFSGYFIPLRTTSYLWRFNTSFTREHNRSASLPVKKLENYQTLRNSLDGRSSPQDDLFAPSSSRDYQWFKYQYMMMTNIDRIPHFDSSKITEAFKLELISIGQSLIDTANSLIMFKLVGKRNQAAQPRSNFFLSFESIPESSLAEDDDIL
jgi:hypothetical protein